VIQIKGISKADIVATADELLAVAHFSHSVVNDNYDFAKHFGGAICILELALSKHFGGAICILELALSDCYLQRSFYSLPFER